MKLPWKRKWKWVKCEKCLRPVRKDLLHVHQEGWCTHG